MGDEWLAYDAKEFITDLPDDQTDDQTDDQGWFARLRQWWQSRKYWRIPAWWPLAWRKTLTAERRYHEIALAQYRDTYENETGATLFKERVANEEWRANMRKEAGELRSAKSDLKREISEKEAIIGSLTHKLALQEKKNKQYQRKVKTANNGLCVARTMIYSLEGKIAKQTKEVVRLNAMLRPGRKPNLKKRKLKKKK